MRCAAYRQGGDDARLAHLEANAHKVAKAGIVTRRTVDSVTRNVTNRIAANRKVGVRLSATLDTAEVVLANDSATVTELRASLTAVTAEARVYRDSTDVLFDAVGSLILAHDAERIAQDSLIAAKDAVIRALNRRECRVLGVRCPSRRTVFLGGVITGVLTLAVAR